MLETVMSMLPPKLRVLLAELPLEVLSQLEEIRVRDNRPLELMMHGKCQFITADGKLTAIPAMAYKPNREDCNQLLDLLTNHSVYTLDEELKRGYITMRGGHRVGISGKAVLEHGVVKQLRDISSFNIRIAREIIGAAEPVMPKLLDISSSSVHHTLIVSPPQQGKTTLVRDLARMISSGQWNHRQMPEQGLKVGIVDERSEIAALVRGVPTFNIGPRTDVLDGCPKAEGMMMMIRSMSPEVIIVDEIGRPEDATAIHEALHAGIRVIATAHGHSFEDIRRRPMLNKLMEEQVFSRYCILGHDYGIGRIHRIYDKAGRMLEAMIVRSGSRHA